MGYRKTVLKNGLRVVSERVAGFRSVTIGLWVEVGSRHETKKLAGVSHFLEHMVFKGTRTRSAEAIALSLESLGGVLNAFTGREQTCYYARLLGEHLPRALDVLADLLVNPKISSRDLKKERNVICEEIKDVEDAPSDYLHDLFCENLWVDHPIGRPIMGTVKSVSALNRKDVRTHRSMHYTPGNIIVAAAGNVDHDRLVRLVRRHCRLADAENNQPTPIPPSEAAQRNGVVQRDLNQVHVCLGTRTVPFVDRRRHALLVLNNLLGGGMSSRLFQAVREKRGLVYTIYSFHDFFKDSGVFGIYFGTGSKEAVQATDVVFNEVRKAKKRLLPSNLLHDVKQQIKGNLLLGMESTSNRMHRLARHEIFVGKSISAKQTMAAVDRVTAQDVRELANEILTSESISTSMIGAVDDKTIRNLDWDKLK